MKDNAQYILCISRPLSTLELIPYSCVRETEGILSTNQETFIIQIINPIQYLT